MKCLIQHLDDTVENQTHEWEFPATQVLGFSHFDPRVDFAKLYKLIVQRGCYHVEKGVSTV